MSKSVTALAAWFGSNRTLAENVGRALAGCNWVCVPFAGGMCELRHITASTIMVSDVHRHVINLANVLKSDRAAELIRDLRRTPFHPDVLREAQETCQKSEGLRFGAPGEDLGVSYAEARAFFICAWMARSGAAGSKSEFTAAASVRWDGSGGSSCVRFRSATEALRDWHDIMPRCEFLVASAFDVLPKVRDVKKTGIYADSPFPDAGLRYKNPFTEDDLRKLAGQLSRFENARVVVRYYRHPLIEELYPVGPWEWHDLAGGRDAHNSEKPEVLIVKNGTA